MEVHNQNDCHLLDGYLDRQATALELRIKVRTLSKWTHMPDGIPHVKFGNRVMYPIAEVRQWVADKITRPNPRRSAA